MLRSEKCVGCVGCTSVTAVASPPNDQILRDHCLLSCFTTERDPALQSSSKARAFNLVQEGRLNWTASGATVFLAPGHIQTGRAKN